MHHAPLRHGGINHRAAFNFVRSKSAGRNSMAPPGRCCLAAGAGVAEHSGLNSDPPTGREFQDISDTNRII